MSDHVVNRPGLFLRMQEMKACVGPILLVTPWYPPTIGGVAIVAQRLHRLFTAAGVSTIVWVCDAKVETERASDDAPAGLFYRWIPATVFHGLTLRSLVATLLRAPVVLWQAYKVVRRHRIRTVVLLYPMGYAWPFVVLRWLRCIRLVASCHGNEMLSFSASSPLARRLFRAVLRTSDAITVPADHLIGTAKEICPGRALPITLIPNCVDDSYFIPRPPDLPRNERPTLIHISAFTPRKRTLDIVEAFAAARLPTATRLLMVGSGPDLQAAKDLAKSLGVSDSVDFVGAPKDVRAYLWESDVLVMASDEESGPLTLLEAMACEVPWIMTPWGIAMTLAQDEYGRVVPGRAPRELAAAMEVMLQDRARLLDMGVRGRQKVVEAFGQARYLERHLSLIRAVERQGQQLTNGTA